jgi:hypothetical protein
MTKQPPRTLTVEGYKPSVSIPQTVTKGYQAPNKVQGGHVAPTQSAPTNAPTGGSSVKPPSSANK